MNYKDTNKQQEPIIRTVEYSQHVQKWWWSFSKGQRVVFANMAGLTINGKSILNYDQISHNFNVAYACYKQLA